MDKITLDIHYTTRIAMQPATGEEVMVVKTQFKPIKYHEYKPKGWFHAVANDLPIDIKEGEIPEIPKVEETRIDIPSVTHWDNIPEDVSHISNFIEMLETHLKYKCLRELKYKIEAAFITHDIRNDFEINLIKDENV